jgi:transposase
MESTGSYWKPVFNMLEEAVKVYLANPHEVKARKGHKTDEKDGWWLAHLLRHAMIHPSFIPPRSIRELRDLTRRRERLTGDGTSEKNRVQKILEDAHVKLGNVLSDVFGVSGQLMLNALLKGETKPEEIAGEEEDSRDHRSVGGASDERTSSKDDPLQSGPHAVFGRTIGGVGP